MGRADTTYFTPPLIGYSPMPDEPHTPHVSIANGVGDFAIPNTDADVQ